MSDPEPYYHDEAVTLYHGDCIEVMRALPEASVDAVVCDPPYGIEFMGKAWDSFRVDDTGTDRFRGERAGVHGEAGSWDGGTHPARAGTAPPTSLAFQNWCRTWAIEAYRVLKPGGHLLAFGAPRLYHRLASGIEDAGFEVRDSLDWMYGSGFPKGVDVERSIAEIDCTEPGRHFWRTVPPPERYEQGDHVCAVSERSAPWLGYDVALKPAHEPVVMARKPLEGTVAANVLQYGTGAINVDGCRIVSQGQRPIMEAWGNEPNLCDSCAVNANESARRTPPASAGSTAPSSAAPTLSVRDDQPQEGICRAVTGCSAGLSPEAPNTGPSAAGSSSTEPSGKPLTAPSSAGSSSITSMGSRPTTGSRTCASCGVAITSRSTKNSEPIGRWPSNVLMDEEAAAMLDAQVGEAGAGGRASGPSREDGTNWNNTHGVFNGTGDLAPFYADSGGASRFFFVSEGVKWETNVHVVSDAGIRCASCGTVTALSPARASASPANSDRGQDSTDGSASSTQRQSLVSSAEDLDGTAITLTTPTYCGSCGCALPVTVALTNSASMGKAAAASDPATETRFRYDAKASRSEREAGLEAVEPAVVNTETPPGTAGANSPRAGARRNDHPTVKPVSVMAWLCRLVTPPGGVVLDPFLGSGTTAMAALDEGFRCIGIEREEGYIFKARLRVTHRHLLELQPVEAQPEIPQGRLF